MLSGSHSADSISTSVVFSSQPECSPPMMPAIDSTPFSSAMTHISGVSVYSRPSSASTFSPSLRAAHGQIAGDLLRVEDMQRPAAVEGDVVGDVDQRVDGPQPDGDQPLLQPFRRRAVLDAAHQPQREAGAELRRVAESSVTFTGHLALAGDRLDGAVLQPAEAGRGEVAGDAVDAGRVRPVRRQIDLDHRIVEMRIGGEAGADRRIVGQVDDAVMLVGQLQLALRAHHAAALDAADLADRQRHVDAGNIGAGRGEGADQARRAHSARRRPPAPAACRRRCRPSARAACRRRDAVRPSAPWR